MKRRAIGFNQFSPMESGLMYGTLVFFLAAMAVGAWDLVSLFQPSARQAVLQALMAQEIRTPDALWAWYMIHTGITVLTVFSAWILGGALILALLLRDQDRAMEGLSRAIQGLRTILRIVRLVLIAVFVFKFTRFTVQCIGINGGSMLFFGMLLFEGVLFTLVMLGFSWMNRFLSGASDSICAVRYMLISGEADPTGIHPGTVLGLHMLAAVHVILAFLYRWNPAMCGLEWSMVIGYLLLGIWLRQYRSAMEWQLLESKSQN